MPDWKVHIIFGFLLLALWLNTINNFFSITLNLQSLFILILIIPFISTFPDIDSKHSKSRKLISLLLSIFISAIYIFLFPSSWYYGVGYFCIIYFLIRFFPTKHRGLTHNFLFSLIFSFATTYLLHLALNFGEAEFLSFFSLLFLIYCFHLVLDKF